MRAGALSLAAGQYLPGTSPVHARDARFKLLACLAFLVVVFAVRRWEGLALLGAGLLAALLLLRAPVGYLWRGLRPLIALLFLTFVLQLFGYPGTPLFGVGPFAVTREGLAAGAFFTSRLVLLLVAGLLLTLSTPPVALTDSIEWLIGPLRRLRVPTAEIALMMSIALRFVPTLLRELDGLLMAQRARGADLTVRDPRRMAQALLPVAVPLFVSSFRHADDLAQAMTSRCYRGGIGRTRYRELHFGAGDLFGALVVVAWLGAAVAVGR